MSAFTQGRRHHQALPLLPSKDLKAVESILTPPKWLYFCRPQSIELQAQGATDSRSASRSGLLELSRADSDPTQERERPREE